MELNTLHFRSPASDEAESFQDSPADPARTKSSAVYSSLLPETEANSPPLQHKKRQGQRPCSPAFLADWWFRDLTCLVASAGVLVAIIRICGHYDGRPQPAWGPISLNTGIAWLSAMSKLLLFVPLAKSMGQLKWIWMAQNTRTLSDLEIFDSSSRGMVGSIRVLVKTRGF